MKLLALTPTPRSLSMHPSKCLLSSSLLSLPSALWHCSSPNLLSIFSCNCMYFISLSCSGLFPVMSSLDDESDWGYPCRHPLIIPFMQYLIFSFYIASIMPWIVILVANTLVTDLLSNTDSSTQPPEIKCIISNA